MDTLSHKQRVNRNLRYIKKLRSRPTRPEVVVGKYLMSEGVYFIFQKGFLKPFRRIADFYLPKRKIIIEVDGALHDKDKDAMKDMAWELGRTMRTIRIKNTEVWDGSFKAKLQPFIYEKIEADKKRPKGHENFR